MYKPRTIGQFKVMEFLKRSFVLDSLIIAPISRNGLMLMDRNADIIAFELYNGTILQCPVPSPGTLSDMRLFISNLNRKYPDLRSQTFDAKTTLWLETPNSLTYQQALGLTDELYRHYLTHPMMDKDEILRQISTGFVSQDLYRSIQLWYLNGHAADTFLVISGIDGTGTLIELIFHYQTPAADAHRFYLLEA